MGDLGRPRGREQLRLRAHTGGDWAACLPGVLAHPHAAGGAGPALSEFPLGPHRGVLHPGRAAIPHPRVPFRRAGEDDARPDAEAVEIVRAHDLTPITATFL